jgi:hypothetical protein
MDDLHTILPTLIEMVVDIREIVSVVLHSEVYHLLHSLYVLELDLMLLIDTEKMNSRYRKLRELAMEHNCSLSERKMCLIFQSQRTDKVIDMCLLNLMSRLGNLVRTIESSSICLQDEVADSVGGEVDDLRDGRVSQYRNRGR